MFMLNLASYVERNFQKYRTENFITYNWRKTMFYGEIAKSVMYHLLANKKHEDKKCVKNHTKQTFCNYTGIKSKHLTKVTGRTPNSVTQRTSKL